MRRTTAVFGTGSGLLLAALLLGMPARGADAAGASPTTIDLWPVAAPGETGSIGAEQAKTKAGTNAVVSLTNVTKPTLTIHRPPADRNTGVAVVVCPGGGYTNLAWDHEGEQVARWLNSLGVTAALLKYRVPRREGTPRDQPPPQALMDAQRALRIVRTRAADWGVDPARIGLLGFSAGGHLTAWASTQFGKSSYAKVDVSDDASPRPDFAVMVYAGGVVKGEPLALAPEIEVSAKSPPTFLAHSSDDRVTPENSVHYYLALRRAGVPAELHLYASGGHGYGMRPGEKPCATWPDRCEAWLRDLGVLKPASKG